MSIVETVFRSQEPRNRIERFGELLLAPARGTVNGLNRLGWIRVTIVALTLLASVGVAIAFDHAGWVWAALGHPYVRAGLYGLVQLHTLGLGIRGVGRYTDVLRDSNI